MRDVASVELTFLSDDFSDKLPMNHAPLRGMERRQPTQLDLPFNTLGLAAKRVVEGLRETKDSEGRADERGQETGKDDRVEAHQPLPMPMAMSEALEVAFRPAFEQRRRATRAEFKGWNGKPRRRRE